MGSALWKGKVIKMGFILVFGLLAVNFLISWPNASYVGRYWSESKEVGGSFRSYVVCGYVMSVAGFTMVYGYILLLLAPIVMQIKGIDANLIMRFEVLASDLIYLLVAVPIILSGFRIWVGSLRAAWEERSFAHIATAGWNTFAQIHNGISFARNAPSAFGRVTDALFGDRKSGSRSRKKDDGMIVVLAIVLVILALLAGYFTADAIMKRADAEYDMFGNLERKYRHQQQQAEYY